MFRQIFRRPGTATLFVVNNGLQSLLFEMIFTAALVYRVTTAHLDALQLVLVGTALEASVFIFEVPTGIVADVYSRRLSIIIGVLITGIAFIIEGSFPIFVAILLAEALWGFGYTFTSGATSAWMVDEIGQEKAGPIFLRSAQVENMAAAAGIGLSMLLGGIAIQLPIILGGAGFIVLGLFLTLAMTEAGFKPAPREDRNPIHSMAGIFGDGLRAVRGRPLLAIIMAITAVAGAASEGFDRLYTPHFLAIGFPQADGLQPVHWFGAIKIAIMLLVAGASRLTEKRLDTARHRPVALALAALTAVTCAGVIGFGLAGTFAAALVAFLIARLARSLSSSLREIWINQHVEARVRATVLSMNGQMDALGQITLGPLFGWLGVAASLRAALIASGLALSPALLLYGRALRHNPEAVGGEEVAALQDA